VGSYYDDHAKLFFDQTFAVDMSDLYAPFLERLPRQATILDAGCGSGRDALAFSQQGYRVLAFDASPELVELACQHTRLDIQSTSFVDFATAPASIHGIWACASLVHLPYPQLQPMIKKLGQYLVTAGVFYCSFKYGDDQVERGGRHFTNLNEKLLQDVVHETGLKLELTWQTEDRRPDRAGEFWLNAILVKC
jgi:SAM-dependent methyltransferase